MTTPSILMSTLEKLAEKAANRARAEAGDGAAVFVFILRGPQSASSLATSGPTNVDQVIGAIVQSLGNLRTSILKAIAEQDVAAARPSEKPQGEN